MSLLSQTLISVDKYQHKQFGMCPTDVDSEIKKIAHWFRSFCAVLFLPSKPPVVIMRLLSAEKKKDKNENYIGKKKIKKD